MMADLNSKNSRSRFELEQDGQTAYLEFELDNQGWITLWHTEVPEPLRRQGIAGTLLKTAFEYARDNNLKIDIICPIAKDYIEKHPELKSVLKQS